MLPAAHAEVGSASSGHPQAAARRAAGSATCSDVGSAHDHPARLGRDAGAQLLHVVGVRRRGVLAQLGPGTAIRAPGPVRGVERLGLRRQRLTQREVQVNRTRPVPGRGPVGAAGQRAMVNRGLATGLVGADLHEPLDCATVELDLIDGLAGADLTQLGRPVGRQHHQRHPRMPRLDDRGVEVRRRGARRAGHGHGSPGGLRHAERKEPGAALVEDRDHLELGPSRERERQRRAARPRTRHGVAQPAAHQLVHERLNRGVGPVDRLHGAARYPRRARNRSVGPRTRLYPGK